jgi:Leucine-rich repeat (LRR) protein
MLDNTQTTEAGVLKLQQSLPNCTIFASHIYPQPGNTLLPLPPRVGSSDRDWANWLLSHSSLHCRLYADVDPETGIIRAEDLPPIAFHIQRLGFELPSDPSVPQANCDLNAFFFRRLADLPALRELDIAQHVPAEALLGLTTIKTLEKLSIQNKNAGDFHLEAIAKLNGLKSLWFGGEMITDAGLRRLGSWKSLTVLALNGRARDLHGAGFEALSGLANLRTLDVSGAGIDDEGARQIGRLFGLRKLVLRQTWISGKGLADLTGLKDLQILSLSRCRRLQADDLVQLSAFGSLRYLDLSDCRITDRSFAPIINTSPTTKSPRGFKTPSALEAALRKFRNLKVLDLGGTGVSAESLPEIRGGLPGVDITLQQRPLPDLPP